MFSSFGSTLRRRSAALEAPGQSPREYVHRPSAPRVVLNEIDGQLNSITCQASFFFSARNSSLAFTTLGTSKDTVPWAAVPSSSQVTDLTVFSFTMDTMPARIDRVGDLFRGTLQNRQDLLPAIEALKTNYLGS